MYNDESIAQLDHTSSKQITLPWKRI